MYLFFWGGCKEMLGSIFQTSMLPKPGTSALPSGAPKQSLIETRQPQTRPDPLSRPQIPLQHDAADEELYTPDSIP